VWIGVASDVLETRMFEGELRRTRVVDLCPMELLRRDGWPPLPGLHELQRQHRKCFERGDTPVLALARCAASLATLPTVAGMHPDAVVVWFDAHADLNIPENTTTGYLGGLVLSAAIVWWHSGLGAGLSPDRVVLGGTRDLDAPEQALVDAGTIKLATGPSLHAALDQYVGDRPVYFPSTAMSSNLARYLPTTKVPNGLTLDDLADISQRLSQNRIVGTEVAEFEAAADPTDDTIYAQPLLSALAPMLSTLQTDSP
jgi:arginase